MEREFLPNIGELIDRLSIHQLKEVFITEFAEKYKNEMQAIQRDLDKIIMEGDLKLSSQLIRAIICIAQINAHVWNCEKECRKGKESDLWLLRLSHGLNGIRGDLVNHILEIIDDREKIGHKIDCLSSDDQSWQMSYRNTL